jgi:hypothetical protein
MLPRRFSISDLMILIAAAALGTLILRSYIPGFTSQLAFIPTIFPDPWGVWRAHAWLHGPGSCFVVLWMAAMIVIRLRRPRPKVIRFQPGFIACVAVMISLLPGLAWFAAIHHRPGFQRPQGFEQAWAITTEWTDTAVLVSLARSNARNWAQPVRWIP